MKKNKPRSEHMDRNGRFHVWETDGLFVVELGENFTARDVGAVQTVVRERVGKFLWLEGCKER